MFYSGGSLKRGGTAAQSLHGPGKPLSLLQPTGTGNAFALMSEQWAIRSAVEFRQREAFNFFRKFAAVHGVHPAARPEMPGMTAAEFCNFLASIS